jgi:sugar lactone lactonase YvrE
MKEALKCANRRLGVSALIALALFLTNCGGSGDSAAPPTITTQPVDLSVPVGMSAKFFVVSGKSNTPVTYQWKRNRVDIAGATASSFVLPDVALADNGSKWSVAVQNSAGSVVSAEATLSVTTTVPGISLLAGSLGGAGNIDGIGAAARFSQPNAVAVDSSGNLYVTDLYAPSIRKITPTGVVSTLTGSDGTPLSVNSGDASLGNSWASGIAVDGSGNLFVTVSTTVRKISPTGVITTLAGNGVGTGATFGDPTGIAVDGAGIVYVAGTSNSSTISAISPAGVVTTLAGSTGNYGSADGFGSAASFYNPMGLALDGSGNVFVFDSGNGTIRKITPAGMVTTFAGTAGVFGSTDGIGAAASFNQFVLGGISEVADFITTDIAGNVYVADTTTCIIRKITPAGLVTTLAGTAGMLGSADGLGAAARFNYPSAVAIDAKGNLYVTDTQNNTIRKVTSAGDVTTFAGAVPVIGSTDGIGMSASFNGASNVAVDAFGNVFVADTGNQTIRKITPSGMVTTFAGGVGISGSTDGSGAEARFSAPYGIAVDGVGNVYVSDSQNFTIRKISASGVVTTLAGTAGVSGAIDGIGPAAKFSNPAAIATDGNGDVYVADGEICVNHIGCSQNYVRKITRFGVVTTLPNTGGNSKGIVVDSTGNIYLSDWVYCPFNQCHTSTIRKIDSTGAVTTFAGTKFVIGATDGNGAAASFKDPGGVAVDGAGNVYVSDSGNGLVRKIDPAGNVTTVAGKAGSIGVTLGPLPGSLSSGSGLALDASGALYTISEGGVVKIQLH